MNYQYDLYKKMYNTYEKFDCDYSTSASGTPCYSLNIKGSTFEYFGKLKAKTSAAVWVDPSYGMKYYGTVIDLKNFLGHVYIYSSTF